MENNEMTNAQLAKTNAEIAKLMAETAKINSEARFYPYVVAGGFGGVIVATIGVIAKMI